MQLKTIITSLFKETFSRLERLMIRSMSYDKIVHFLGDKNRE